MQWRLSSLLKLLLLTCSGHEVFTIFSYTYDAQPDWSQGAHHSTILISLSYESITFSFVAKEGVYCVKFPINPLLYQRNNVDIKTS